MTLSQPIKWIFWKEINIFCIFLNLQSEKNYEEISKFENKFEKSIFDYVWREKNQKKKKQRKSFLNMKNEI